VPFLHLGRHGLRALLGRRFARDHQPLPRPAASTRSPPSGECHAWPPAVLSSALHAAPPSP
jgi:hypothetical protein